MHYLILANGKFAWWYWLHLMLLILFPALSIHVVPIFLDQKSLEPCAWFHDITYQICENLELNFGCTHCLYDVRSVCLAPWSFNLANTSIISWYKSLSILVWYISVFFVQLFFKALTVKYIFVCLFSKSQPACDTYHSLDCSTFGLTSILLMGGNIFPFVVHYSLNALLLAIYN